MLKRFEEFHDEKVIFAGDFNLIFNSSPEAVWWQCPRERERESPFPPKNGSSEIIKLNKTFNFHTIWRVRNPHRKVFTF